MKSGRQDLSFRTSSSRAMVFFLPLMYFSLFLHPAMLLAERIQQHRVHRFVADSAGLALLIQRH
jgi:hypothetical protein